MLSTFSFSTAKFKAVVSETGFPSPRSSPTCSEPSSLLRLVLRVLTSTCPLPVTCPCGYSLTTSFRSCNGMTVRLSILSRVKHSSVLFNNCLWFVLYRQRTGLAASFGTVANCWKQWPACKRDQSEVASREGPWNYRQFSSCYTKDLEVMSQFRF